MFKRIETGELHPESKDAVFIALWCRVQLDECYGEHAGKTVAQILVQQRHTMRIGMPGGCVDPVMNDQGKKTGWESLLDAVRRECWEEIHLKLENLGVDPSLLCSHGLGHIHTHLFQAEVTQAELLHIMAGATGAEGAGMESMGSFLIFVEDLSWGDDGAVQLAGLPVLLKTPMADSVKEELAVLVKEVLHPGGVISEASMKIWVKETPPKGLEIQRA